jgi:endonuclease G
MKKLLLALTVVFAASVFASDCRNLYPNIKIPVLPNTIELCNSFYVTIFDTNNNGVIFVSEHLTGKNVGSATRVNAFKIDRRLGKSGPTLEDYTGSNYDKGHMVPAADSSNSVQMKDTFLLSNMTPQEASLNRNSWRILEEKIRKSFLKSTGDAHVLTIAVYHPISKRIGKNIPVPSGYWKIVIRDFRTQYFYADNVPNAKVIEASGIDITNLIINAQNF